MSDDIGHIRDQLFDQRTVEVGFTAFVGTPFGAQTQPLNEFVHFQPGAIAHDIVPIVLGGVVHCVDGGEGFHGVGCLGRLCGARNADADAAQKRKGRRRRNTELVVEDSREGPVCDVWE